MIPINKVASATLIAATFALAGCTMDDGYGYSSVSVGYGAPYYDYGYGPYDYAPYGWYDGFYYPGSGYWMYDGGGRRHRWSDRHRNYWEQRRQHADRWSGPSTQPWRRDLRDDRGRWQGQPRGPAAGADGRNWRDRGERRVREATPTPQQGQSAAPAPQGGDNNRRGGWERARGRRGN